MVDAAFRALTNIDFQTRFEVFVVWRLRAGSGPVKDMTPANAWTIFTLAIRPWQFTVHAYKGKKPDGNLDDYINAFSQDSKVTLSHDPNQANIDVEFIVDRRKPIIVGLTANYAL